MQQIIQSVKGPIHTKIELPGAKTITQRALLLSALADGVSEITGMNISSATLAMLKALHQLGIAIQLDEKSKSCIIAGGNGTFPKKQATIWCEKSQIIFHFLMAACATSAGIYYFDAPTRLSEKINMQILNILSRQGIQLIPSDAKKMPFTLIGTESLEGGEIAFNKPINNQIISALLMSAPFARSPVTINLLDSMYDFTIDMTCTMMAEYGVLVHRMHQTQLMIPVPQRYQAKDYAIEPDFALASYFFAAAAITTGEITIQPTKRLLSKQPHSKFLSILEKMGCRVLETHTGLSIQGPHQLQGIEVSLRNFSDIFLALSVIAPFAKSPSRIAHIGHMHQKEFERLTAVKSRLIARGVHVEAGHDWIKIFPSMPKGGLVNAHHDHRIAMAFAIMGLRVPGITIEEMTGVNKIYPNFFKQWHQLTEDAHTIYS
ncbi:MAG TPA: 3-phosphoshikimate 1-carboxyvinyltransferase [Gammaproteobacteria bacterium]|nr:3-phosphoshikimate 1-carboxyvinyltransferase [Gammaproteobacteria bacterium]